MRKLISKFSPLTVVCMIAIIVVASSAIGNRLLSKSNRTINPRVITEIKDGSDGQALNKTENHRNVVITAIDGEVSRTADRIGEAQALALATSLYAITEQLKGRAPQTTDDLLKSVAIRNLLPPGLKLTDKEGALISEHSNLFVRYRAAPLGIEIVSLGREQRDGPAILVRVPDENSKEGGVSLFLATRLSNVSIPPAFTSTANVISAGWSPEPLHLIK
ncbi:MAG: hypothetical protein WBV94_28320 [Blastocatellia bacterium]